MFLPLEPYEFTLLQLSQPSQKISKEDKCYKIIWIIVDYLIRTVKPHVYSANHFSA